MTKSIVRFVLAHSDRRMDRNGMCDPQSIERFSPWLAEHLTRCRALAAGAKTFWPIELVGMFEELIVLRDRTGRVSGVPSASLTRLRILGLFDGDATTLRRDFPSASGRGWDAHHAAEGIMNAACAVGQIDPVSIGLVPVYRQPRAGGSLRVMLLPKRQPPAQRTA